MKIIYFLTWAIFTTQLFAMYNNTPRQLYCPLPRSRQNNCPLPRSKQNNTSQQPHYQNNVQFNNIETNNEINATNINIANPIKQNNEIKSHKYSYEEIEGQRNKYYENRNKNYENNPIIEIKTKEDLEYLDLKKRIEYIVNEGTKGISKMILLTHPEEQKNLINYAIRTYLRAAVEANIEQLYEIEAELYFKALEKEENSARQLLLLNSIKYSIFKSQENNEEYNSFHIEEYTYNIIVRNAKNCEGKQEYIRRYKQLEKKFKYNYECPEIDDKMRIANICNAYNIYNYCDDFYDEYTQLNLLILNKKNPNLPNECNNNECNDNECNNIETNNEINSHKYSYEEIKKQRNKYYEVNQENKTDKDPEDKMYKKEINPFLCIRRKFACLQAANPEEDLEEIEERIEHIIEEGDAYIKAMNFSTCPKERKILLDYAIRTYLRGAVEANIEQLYDIEGMLYSKVLKKECDAKRQLLLLNSEKYSIFKKDLRTNSVSNFFYIERLIYSLVLEVEDCDEKQEYIEKYLVEEKFKDNYECPEIDDKKRIVDICNTYDIYNYCDDYYDESTPKNSSKALNYLKEFFKK